MGHIAKKQLDVVKLFPVFRDNDPLMREGEEALLIFACVKRIGLRNKTRQK